MREKDFAESLLLLQIDCSSEVLNVLRVNVL